MYCQPLLIELFFIFHLSFLTSVFASSLLLRMQKFDQRFLHFALQALVRFQLLRHLFSQLFLRWKFSNARAVWSEHDERINLERREGKTGGKRTSEILSEGSALFSSLHFLLIFLFSFCVCAPCFRMRLARRRVRNNFLRISLNFPSLCFQINNCTFHSAYQALEGDIEWFQRRRVRNEFLRAQTLNVLHSFANELQTSWELFMKLS